MPVSLIHSLAAIDQGWLFHQMTKSWKEFIFPSYQSP